MTSAKQTKEEAEFNELIRKTAKEGFEEYDKNKSGYIDLSEVEVIVKEIVNTPDAYTGPKLSDEQIKQKSKELLSQFDTNKDNKLSFDEFMEFMKQFMYSVAAYGSVK